MSLAPTADTRSADLQRQVALLDLVDRILEKGAVIRGQLVLSVAEVELVKLDLSLLLGAVDTLQRLGR
ncbi:MAG TPA: gas vesicle protein GvpJ [Acidimicrobiales bacterium]|nr:gas vesicle protein GvpJ [Acidimicrobiales bacterium]